MPSPAFLFPQKTLSDAIRAGIVLGVASALDGLIARYAENSGLSVDEFRVVLTGGDARTLTPHVRKSHQIISNLVCQGLLQLEVGRS